MAVTTPRKRHSIHTIRTRRPVMIPKYTKDYAGRSQLAGIYPGLGAAAPSPVRAIMTAMRGLWGPI